VTRRVAQGLVVLLAAAAGCRKAPPPAPELPVVEAPVPAPDGRLADVALASPNAAWARAQRGVGGLVAVLPSTFGGLLCAASGLDVGFAAEIDGAAPAFAVLALSPEGKWTFAVAAKLVDGGHARAVLVDADTARFDLRDGGGAGAGGSGGGSAIALVVPKGGGASPLAVGLGGRGPSAYLLIADSDGSLARLGPYAYRTLPTRPVPASGLVAEVPRDALAGTLHDEVQRQWTSVRTSALREDEEQRARHGGRAPDFGDAPAIVATLDSVVGRMTALAADLDSVRLAVDADADTVHAELTLQPAPGGGAASELVDGMTVGDPSPLGRLPPEALVGVMTRDGASGRARDGAALEATLAAALGARLRADDAKKLHAAIADWESARGDWLAAAVVPPSSPPTPGHGMALAVRTPARDGDKAATAVRELVELATLPALQAPLRTLLSVTGVSVQRDASAAPAAPAATGGPRLDHVGLATLQRAGSKDAKAGLAWGVEGGDLLVAAGEDPRAELGVFAIHPEVTVDPATSALAQLGDETSFALVARPFPAASKRPVIFGWGRHAHAGWARAEVPDVVVRELVRRQAGL
jgi:hypothetical protein